MLEAYAIVMYTEHAHVQMINLLCCLRVIKNRIWITTTLSSMKLLYAAQMHKIITSACVIYIMSHIFYTNNDSNLHYFSPCIK